MYTIGPAANAMANATIEHYTALGKAPQELLSDTTNLKPAVMNEIVTLAEIAVKTLTTDVIHLLKTEIGDQGTVGSLGNQVIVSIKQADFELRMGNILQQIYRVIDQHFPVRTEHLSIVIRDANSTYENVFKVWKSA